LIPARHRSADPALRVGRAHALAAGIGIAPELFGRRERDSTRERADEVADCVTKRAIDAH